MTRGHPGRHPPGGSASISTRCEAATSGPRLGPSYKPTIPGATLTRDRAPHISLMELARLLPRILTDRDTAAMADWCTRHGLLGILLHRVHSVVLAPAWHTDTQGHWAGRGRRPTFQWPGVRRYVRSPTGWTASMRSTLRVGRVHKTPDKVLQSQGKPRALLHDLHGDNWTEELLSKTWAHFFPDVPGDQRDVYNYPVPLSREFWEQYAEPVEEFAQAAATFAEALAPLAGPPIWLSHNISSEQRERLRDGQKRLNALLLPVYTILTVDSDGVPRERWQSHSLLATCALMARQDLLERRRIINCRSCGRVFVTNAHQARYCSQTCRNRDSQRAWRARHQR
jgi:hypothetical protein